MTLTADSKRRVIIPSARPGDLFEIQTAGEGKFTLTRLEPIHERPNRGHFEKRGKYSVFVTERPISLDAIKEALADFPSSVYILLRLPGPIETCSLSLTTKASK